MTDSLTYALLSQQAYLHPPNIGNINGAGRAIVTLTDDGRVLTFRGSDDLESWLHDFEITTTPILGLGEVHEGFWSAWMEIAVRCLDVQPEVVAVHSLGGALALIAAANLCLTGTPPKAVYAFEPPRISTDHLIHKLLIDNGVKLYIFRNGRDAITQTPMAVPGWSWNEIPLIHVGDQTELFENIVDHNILNVIDSIREYVDGLITHS